MATIVAAAGGGNWNATGTWVGGVVPTAADDVQLNGTSGNVTINVNSVCRSLDCTGYTGTLNHSSTATLSVGDATAGAGSIAFKLVAGMTYTVGTGVSSTLAFVSTSTTQQTVDAAGKTCGSVTFNGAGGSWKLTGAMKQGSGAVLTLTAGTLNTNGQTLDIGGFNSSNSNTRTLTLGASAISLLNSWNTGTATNMTVSTNTATVTLTGSSPTFSNGSINWNGLSVVFNGSGAPQWSGSSATVANLTRTGTAAKTDALVFNATTTTVTGILTLNGNSATNRLLVYSSTVGTARTITAASVSASNVDIRDVTAAGVASWDLSAITGNSGDAGNNTGITFTTAATQTWSGTSGGNWSTNAWTSRVPLPQDNVVISSAFSAAQTITIDMPRAGKTIDASSCTGSPKLATSTATQIYGGLKLASGMTTDSSSGGVSFWAQSGTHSIVSNGVSLFTQTSAPSYTEFFCAGATYTLDDATTWGSFRVSYGTVTANANVTAVGVRAENAGTLNLGSVTWTMTGTGVPWWMNASTVVNAGTSTIKLTNTGNITEFTGASKTYYALEYQPSGSGTISFTGNNTFTSLLLACTTAKTITLPGGGSQIVNGTATLKGASGQNLTLSASSTSTIRAQSFVTEYLTLTNVKLNQQVLGTGIASGLAFGSATVSYPVAQTINASGIASGETFGSAAVGLWVAPSGIASGAALGSPSVAATASVSPTGIASGQALGSATVSATAGITASGIGSTAAFGDASVAPISNIAPIGIASGAQTGSPSVSSSATVAAAGIASGEATGSATVTASATVAASGIPSGAAVGSPAVVYNQTVSATGIASGAVVGQAGVAAVASISVTALSSSVGFGALTATTVAYVLPSGIAGGGTGTPRVSRFVLQPESPSVITLDAATAGSLALSAAAAGSLTLTPEY